jgi:hypothetical protein
MKRTLFLIILTVLLPAFTQDQRNTVNVYAQKHFARTTAVHAQPGRMVRARQFLMNAISYPSGKEGRESLASWLRPFLCQP